MHDKISFSGDTMKKQYLIYADESHRKGKYFSNFGSCTYSMGLISRHIN